MKTLWRILLTVCLVLVSTQSDAAVLIDEDFESGWGAWECYNGSCSSNAKGAEIVSDESTPDGNKSLRFTFPAGFPSGSSPDIVSRMFAGQEELWIRYFMKVSSGWVDQPVFNKHLYVMDYATVPNHHSEFIGHSWWGDHKVGMTTQDQVDTMDFYGSGISIQPNRWYQITWHLKSNDPKKNYIESGCSYKCRRSDGVAQIWVKDLVTGVEQLAADKRNVMIRADSASRYDRLKIAPVWGGEGSQTVPGTQYMYIDKVAIYTENPGEPSPSATNPSPPSHIIIIK